MRNLSMEQGNTAKIKRLKTSLSIHLAINLTDNPTSNNSGEQENFLKGTREQQGNPLNETHKMC